MRLKLIILLFWSITSYAQNLTVDEMLHLKAENIAGIEEYLSVKGWSLLSSHSETSQVHSKVSFAYNKSKDNDNAESFLNCLYSQKTGTKVLDLQLHSQDKYNRYLSAIKTLGCNLVHSKIGEDKVTKVYQGETMTFVVKVKTKKGKTSTDNIYHIFIMSNADYKLNSHSNLEVLPQVADAGIQKNRKC